MHVVCGWRGLWSGCADARDRLRFCWLHVRAVFFCRGSNVYLKFTEEYCFCVVKNLNTHVEIMKLNRYIVCLFIYYVALYYV